MKDYKKYAELLWPDDKYILGIRLLNNPQYEMYQVNRLFAGVEIDNTDYAYLSLLAFLGDYKNWLYFPKEAIPKLSGLVRYNRAHNHRLLNEVAKTCNELTQKRIPNILVGESALCHYCENAFNNSVLKAAVIVPSFIRIEAGQYVRYPKISPRLDNILKYMLDESVTKNMGGLEIELPSPEHLAIILLMEGFYETVAGINCDEACQWMLNISILAHRIDWDRLMHCSVMMKVDKKVSLMLKLFDVIIPGLIPQSTVKDLIVDTGWIERRYKLSKFRLTDRFRFFSDMELRFEALKYLNILEGTTRYHVKKTIKETIKNKIHKAR